MKAGFNWIDDLAPAAREAMAAAARWRTLDSGVLLYAQGDVATELYQIAAGAVRQSILSRDGAEVLVYQYERGDVVADSSALDRAPVPVNMTTRGRTRLRAWSFDTFDAIRRQHPEIDTALAIQSARRLRVILRRLAELSTLSPPARIASRLLSLADISGSLELKLSQADIAMAVGTSRQTVNQTIQSLRERGILRCGYGVIAIVDRDALIRFEQQSAG